MGQKFTDDTVLKWVRARAKGIKAPVIAARYRTISATVRVATNRVKAGDVDYCNGISGRCRIKVRPIDRNVTGAYW